MGYDRKNAVASGSVERGVRLGEPGGVSRKRPGRKVGPETGSRQFEVAFSRALAALDVAVHELLASGWEETRRRRALELSTALCDASNISGWKELRGILRAITSLLEMPLREILPVRVALREKLLELLGLLMDSEQVRTA